MYDHPQFSINDLKKRVFTLFRQKIFLGVVALVIAICLALLVMGTLAMTYFPNETNGVISYIQWYLPKPSVVGTSFVNEPESYESRLSYEQAIIDAAKKVSPSVVSIVISKNVPIYEEQLVNPFGSQGMGGNLFNFQIPQYVQKGSKLQEVGAGSGFIVSVDGLILTNKHVVSDVSAQYTVFTNDGTKYQAKVLALDPAQDLAVIKIESAASNIITPVVFPAAVLADSSGIQIGQTAIAIGNALGQFSNSVSVGVVSGLGRTVSASDQSGGFSETLEGIIQTDAAINSGNSGGPLVNLNGEVIGINTAMAQDAQSVGFAIPINEAKRDIQQVILHNAISYPFLGVRYALVDESVQEEYQLSVDYGALVLPGKNGETAIVKDSAGEKAGIQPMDLILEVDGEKVTTKRTLAGLIKKYNPSDTITVKILRNGKEISLPVTLGSR